MLRIEIFFGLSQGPECDMGNTLSIYLLGYFRVVFCLCLILAFRGVRDTNFPHNVFFLCNNMYLFQFNVLIIKNIYLFIKSTLSGNPNVSLLYQIQVCESAGMIIGIADPWDS